MSQFQRISLLNHLTYSSVNKTVSCSASLLAGNAGSCYISDIVERYGGLSGNGRYTPSQPFGFTAAFDPRRIQLGARFTF